MRIWKRNRRWLDMPTKQILPPPPTTMGSSLSPTDYQWLLIAQNLHPHHLVDTAKGDYHKIFKWPWNCNRWRADRERYRVHENKSMEMACAAWWQCKSI